MSGKPELSASAGLQNVVVYVSNDNFAQAYAVGQNVPPNLTSSSHPSIQQNGTYTTNTSQHSMAPMVGPTKCFNNTNNSGKCSSTLLKAPDYLNNQIVNGAVVHQQQQGYYAEVLPQNGFSQQPLINNNLNYPNNNNATINSLKNYNNNGEILSSGSERQQAGPGRPELLRECDNREAPFADSNNYVSVLGTDCPSQSVRCDSVRSETAESSCSSSSSADEGLVVVQNPAPEMVVYDSSVSVRPGGVVLAVGPSSISQQTASPLLVGSSVHNQGSFVSVPFGWKRLVNSGNVIYISPSNTALSSPEQIKDYLLSSGTCKCGLECHFKYDSVFNFDPKVSGKPWTLQPDTNLGDMTKLCNHKRKIMAMASLECKQTDPNMKLSKDYNAKRKKRRIEMPYCGSGVPVSHIMTQREKMTIGQQQNVKGVSSSNPQVWQMQQQQQQMHHANRLHNFPENISAIGYAEQESNENRVVSECVPENSMINPSQQQQQQQIVSNISQQNEPMQTQPRHANIHIHHQHLIGPNGQIISLQKGAPPQPMQQTAPPILNSQMVNNTSNMFPSQKFSQTMPSHNHNNNNNNNQQAAQQRIFNNVNVQPNEPSGPGRPAHGMIPLGIDNQQQQQQQRCVDVQQRPLLQHQQQQQYFPSQNQPCPQINQYDPKNVVRPQYIPPNNQAINGFRPQMMMNQQGQMLVQQQQQMMVNPGQQQKMQWQNNSRLPVATHNPSNQQQNQMPLQNVNVYERIPNMHQHPGTSTSIWHEEIKKKKMRSKGSRSRGYVLDGQNNQAPCPNIDVREIPNDNSRAVIINQMATSNQHPSGPSFMEDPSGYLAQQTALLNNTINRQVTGANPCGGYICNSPSSMHPAHNPSNIISITNNSQTNEVPLPSNVMVMKHNQNITQRVAQSNSNVNLKTQQVQQQIPVPLQQQQQQQFNQVITQGVVPDSSASSDQKQQTHNLQCQGCIADSMNPNQQQYVVREQQQQQGQKIMQYSRPNSQPGTPSSSGGLEDVSSSTFSEKQQTSHNSPDNRPIQGGTVSTSNVSPIDGLHSGPPTPNPHTPSSMTPTPLTPNPYASNPHTPGSYTPNCHTPTPTPQSSTPNQIQVHHNPQQQQQIQAQHQPMTPDNSQQHISTSSQPYMVQRISDSQTGQNYIVYSSNAGNNGNNLQQDIPVVSHHQVKEGGYSSGLPSIVNTLQQQQHHHDSSSHRNQNMVSGMVTTMASGRTVSSNTITSVLAGRANTATVSINNSPQNILNNSSPPSSIQNGQNIIQTQHHHHHQPPGIVNVSKSPLEMVQSVVSSIQVPHSQQHATSIPNSNTQHVSHSALVKSALPPGHILVSSGGQLIMANTGNCQTNVMPPPPPKLLTANQASMPPISASPIVSNVTAAVTQMIPAVAQQMLGQQTVLVNALPAPFVLQPGVTMTMDGVAVGQNMQIPQLVAASNVIQQQVQIESADSRRGSQGMLSPESKKKGKKRKVPSQTVAGMLQIAAATQQNPGMVTMQQQNFPQQIQMAHSPQGITASQVMQALTIVPSKNGGPAQIVMNGQATNIGAQQIIANSQPTQQINLLQPVNLINGGAGVVQNFPTIQQFIVPNLGGMVMNPDGTATILQDTSNIGMQLQLQNVNGQNILTQVQNGGVFNGSQNIIAAGPAGMVIRAPAPAQGKLIQQQHSPGAQFLSPNGGQFVVNSGQFGGQLSPLVASVSPSQQVTFNGATQQMRTNNALQQAAHQQEYIQCNQMGQTLMVPCAPANNISASNSNQNTTYVQQNTTIVQQQTTMVSNNPSNNQHHVHQGCQPNVQRTTTLNVDHNFLISSNNNGNENNKQQQQQQMQMQPVLVKECAQTQQQQQQHHPGYRHQSVSTQTATNQSQAVTTNTTFCQTSTVSAGSPPDTTTHSPLALGGQSPPTVDTTTHTGSTDDGLSPAPSNCSAGYADVGIQGRHQSMAMVHCISSSEPDSADLNVLSSEMASNQKNDYGNEISSVGGGQIHYLGGKKSTPTHHFAFAESSTMVSGVHFVNNEPTNKSEEAVVSSRHCEKRKSGGAETLLVVGSRQLHFEEEEESDQIIENRTETNFMIEDLVWGPTRGYPAWPGKIIALEDDKATIKWYGNEKTTTIVDVCCLQSLSDGLEAHHRARKKLRTSRKLNSQLENAIQEAMAELDNKGSDSRDHSRTASSKAAANSRKRSEESPSSKSMMVGRLRSSQK